MIFTLSLVKNCHTFLDPSPETWRTLWMAPNQRTVIHCSSCVETGTDGVAIHTLELNNVSTVRFI